MYTITRYRHSLSILFYFIPTTKVAAILIRSIQGSELGATPLAPHLCTLGRYQERCIATARNIY